MSSPNLPLAVETMSASPVETIPPSHDDMIKSEPMSSGPCTRVFWDLVDYPFPNGLAPDLVYQKMNSILENMGCVGEVSIMAYVDKENFRDEWIDDAYKKARIDIIVVPQEGDDRARGRFMLVDIAVWAIENHSYEAYPISFMVISKQMKKESVFITYLGRLSDAFHRVLLTLDHELPSPPSPPSLHTVIFNSFWTSPLDGVKPIDQSGTLEGSDHKRKSTEETVCSERQKT